MREDLQRWMLSRTLTNDGCSVLDPMCQPNCPVTGYVVGMKEFVTSFEVVENTETWFMAMEALLMIYMSGGWAHSPITGVGTWMCQSCEGESHVHFDVIVWTPREDVARMYAWLFNQIAYYDVEKGKVINVRSDEDGDAHQVDA